MILFSCSFNEFCNYNKAKGEERRLRVLESGVLRGILGAKRDEVTGEWRKLHNEELNDLY